MAEDVGGRRGNRWRLATWGGAAFLLSLPWVAMQFTDEMGWDAADFALLGAMLIGACGAYELAAKGSGDKTHRAAFGVALASAFILVWANLAVGVVGSEDNPVNAMYGGVLAVGIVGAVIARLQPHGMARALVATALAQAVIAVIAGLNSEEPVQWGDVAMVTGFFVALWLMSAWLFRKAARGRRVRGAAS